MSDVAEKSLWTLEDAAKKLSVCRRTVWTMTKTGELPTIRIGRRKLVSPKDVEQWIENKRDAKQ